MNTTWEEWAPFRDTFLITFTRQEAEALQRIGWRLCQFAADIEYQPQETPASSLLASQMAAIALDLRQTASFTTQLSTVLDPDLASRLAEWLLSRARRIDDQLEILREETGG